MGLLVDRSSANHGLSLEPLGVSRRDAAILATMLAKLDGRAPALSLAAQALSAAVVEWIPNGRVYVLGVGRRGPILGSIITGVGIADGDAGVEIVRLTPGGPPTVLARLAQ